MRMGWLIAPVIGVAACVGALAWSAQDDNARSDTYKELELFADVLVRVQNEYVTPIEDKKAIQAAIQGMLTSLDPHSSYLAPEDFKDMQVQTRGGVWRSRHRGHRRDGIVKSGLPDRMTRRRPRLACRPAII